MKILLVEYVTLSDIKMTCSASDSWLANSTVQHCCLDKGCASVSRKGMRIASEAGILHCVHNPQMKDETKQTEGKTIAAQCHCFHRERR